jgi:transcriptional regulator with XRE-family HTH domain
VNGRALFAWNLRRLRSERGISQERLAADAQIDRAYISELERKRGNATLDLLDRIAVVLGVPLIEFFREPNLGEKRPKGLKSGRPPSKR